MKMLLYYYGVTFFAENDDDERVLNELHDKIKDQPSPGVELGHTSTGELLLEIEVA